MIINGCFFKLKKKVAIKCAIRSTPRQQLQAMFCFKDWLVMAGDPDPAKEKKQAQQRNRVDVAGVLGAGSSTSVAGSLPMPQPAPPPAATLLEGVAVVPPAAARIAAGVGAVAPLLAAGASRPDGFVGKPRGSSAGTRFSPVSRPFLTLLGHVFPSAPSFS